MKSGDAGNRDAATTLVSRWINADETFRDEALQIARTRPSQDLKAFLLPKIQGAASPDATALRFTLSDDDLGWIAWSYVAIDLCMKAVRAEEG